MVILMALFKMVGINLDEEQYKLIHKASKAKPAKNISSYCRDAILTAASSDLGLNENT